MPANTTLLLLLLLLLLLSAASLSRRCHITTATRRPDLPQVVSVHSVNYTVKGTISLAVSFLVIVLHGVVLVISTGAQALEYACSAPGRLQDIYVSATPAC
jgi:uncharacterized membrane protein